MAVALVEVQTRACIGCQGGDLAQSSVVLAERLVVADIVNLRVWMALDRSRVIKARDGDRAVGKTARKTHGHDLIGRKVYLFDSVVAVVRHIDNPTDPGRGNRRNPPKVCNSQGTIPVRVHERPRLFFETLSNFSIGGSRAPG